LSEPQRSGGEARIGALDEQCVSGERDEMAPLEAWRHQQVLAPMQDDPIFAIPLDELLAPPALPAAPPPKPEPVWQNRQRLEKLPRGKPHRRDGEEEPADWRDRDYIARGALRRALIEAGL
jgi:hypothetical protein